MRFCLNCSKLFFPMCKFVVAMCKKIGADHIIGKPTVIEIICQIDQAPREECVTENYFSYFSTKTYVVGIQNNLLNETVLLSIQNRCLN